MKKRGFQGTSYNYYKIHSVCTSEASGFACYLSYYYYKIHSVRKILHLFFKFHSVLPIKGTNRIVNCILNMIHINWYRDSHTCLSPPGVYRRHFFCDFIAVKYLPNSEPETKIHDRCILNMIHINWYRDSRTCLSTPGVYRRHLFCVFIAVK